MPRGLEADLLVEVDRGGVRDAHLEGVAAALVFRGHFEQALEQLPGDPAALVVGVDGDVHDVPRVDVAGVDGVAHERVALERAEADRGRLRELGREHRARPRRRVGAALDPLDRVQVGEVEQADLERDGGHAEGTASG